VRVRYLVCVGTRQLEERNERRIAQLETIRTQGMDRARADAAEDDPFDDQVSEGVTRPPPPHDWVAVGADP
jgi:hypothetical protein